MGQYHFAPHPRMIDQKTTTLINVISQALLQNLCNRYNPLNEMTQRLQTFTFVEKFSQKTFVVAQKVIFKKTLFTFLEMRKVIET